MSRSFLNSGTLIVIFSEATYLRASGDASQHLLQQTLHLGHLEGLLHTVLHQRLEVVLHVVHDHVDLVHVAADHNLAHGHHVHMLRLEQRVNLADRSDREAFALLLHLQTLERHYHVLKKEAISLAVGKAAKISILTRLFILGSIDHAVRALLDLIQAFELLHTAAALCGAVVHEWWRRRRQDQVLVHPLRSSCLSSRLLWRVIDTPAATGFLSAG